MASRLTLHEELCTALGSRNVYYQPPKGTKLVFPAIIYERNMIRNYNAENEVYHQAFEYTVTVVDRSPDSDVVARVSQMPRARFSRHYTADGLNHDVFNIYY